MLQPVYHILKKYDILVVTKPILLRLTYEKKEVVISNGLRETI